MDNTMYYETHTYDCDVITRGVTASDVIHAINERWPLAFNYRCFDDVLGGVN